MNKKRIAEMDKLILEACQKDKTHTQSVQENEE